MEGGRDLRWCFVMGGGTAEQSAQNCTDEFLCSFLERRLESYLCRVFPFSAFSGEEMMNF